VVCKDSPWWILLEAFGRSDIAAFGNLDRFPTKEGERV